MAGTCQNNEQREECGQSLGTSPFVRVKPQRNVNVQTINPQSINQSMSATTNWMDGDRSQQQQQHLRTNDIYTTNERTLSNTTLGALSAHTCLVRSPLSSRETVGPMGTVALGLGGHAHQSRLRRRRQAPSEGSPAPAAAEAHTTWWSSSFRATPPLSLIHI